MLVYRGPGALSCATSHQTLTLTRSKEHVESKILSWTGGCCETMLGEAAANQSAELFLHPLVSKLIHLLFNIYNKVCLVTCFLKGPETLSVVG